MNKPRSNSDQPKSSNFLIKLLEREFFTKSDISKWAPFITYCSCFAFLYIANHLYSEKRIKDYNELQRDVRNAQENYYVVKTNIDNLTKPSQIANRVEHLGLKPNLKPVEVVKKDNER